MSLPPKIHKPRQLSRRNGRANALKHGAFSSIQFLPWENPDDLEQLRRDLWAEHKPEGASQEDAVETILFCVWRKRRLRKLRELETLAKMNAAEHGLFESQPEPLFETELERIKHSLSRPSNEKPSRAVVARPEDSARPRASEDFYHLLRMSASFYGEQSADTARWTVMFAPKEFREHLEVNVPQSSFETTRQWIVALKSEIDRVLIPRVRARRPDPRGFANAAAQLLASEKMIEDLAIEERLDASMDRALRRLFWLKSQKQLERDAEQKVVNGKATRIADNQNKRSDDPK